MLSFFQSHTMRVAVCEVLGEILMRVLSGDGLDETSKADRDRFFDILQEHLHDTHSHVRTRVLQVYTRIVNSKVSFLWGFFKRFMPTFGVKALSVFRPCLCADTAR